MKGIAGMVPRRRYPRGMPRRPCSPRTVVLRHTMPDGSHHFDWLFERAGGTGARDDDRVLVTWRLADRPDRAETVDAERIEDHRRVYLSYEGPVSRARGEVMRVAEGVCEIIRDDDEGFEAEVSFEGQAGGGYWVGLPMAGAIWRLVRHEPTGR